MKAQKFKTKVESLIGKIEDMILAMPDHGNTKSDSQKIALLDAINQFSYTVNGVEDSDFKKPKD